MASDKYLPHDTFRDSPQHQSQRALRERSSNARHESWTRGSESSTKNAIFNQPLLRYSSHNLAYLNSRRFGSDSVRDLSTAEQQFVYCQLLKLRERCEAYVKYRSNQDKHVHNRADGVWPDNVEETFWRAVAANPPMGRDKIKLSPHSTDTKAYGRNELIAKFMEVRLGDAFEHLRYDPKTNKAKTPRKVVSSHIQVLKGKFKDPIGVYTENQIVLHWLGKGGDKKNRTARSRASILTSQRPSQHHTNPLEPESFRMYLAITVDNGEKSVHDFTQSHGNCLTRHPDVRITDHNLRNDFPELHSIWVQNRLRCSVIAAVCTINWPSERPEQPKIAGEEKRHGEHQPRRPSPPTHLSIQNTFESKSGVIPRKCHSIVRYLHQGQQTAINGPNKVQGMHEGGRSLFEVKMGSEFWVKLFQTLWIKMKTFKTKAMQSGDSADAEEKIRLLYEETRLYIGQFTAVLEIYSDCEEDADGNAVLPLPPQPMMVVHWTFKAAPHGNAGRTTWRNLVVAHEAQNGDEEEENDMELDNDEYNDYDSNLGTASYRSGSTVGLRASQSGAMGRPLSQISAYDFDQAAAGTGIGLAWPAADYAGRDDLDASMSLPREVPGMGLDLGSSFGFDGMPLDPGMMSNVDVSGLDASMVSSMAVGDGGAVGSQVMPGTSSADMMVHPQLHSHAGGSSSQAPAAASQTAKTYDSFGNLFTRATDGFPASQAVFSGAENAMQAQQLSSLRSTQQIGQPQGPPHHVYSAPAEGRRFDAHFTGAGQSDQLQTPVSLEDVSAMSTRRHSQVAGEETFSFPQQARRPQPPILSILPSQHDEAPHSRRESASAASPHGHGQFTHYDLSRMNTPQSAAGQAPFSYRQHVPDPSQPQQREQQYDRMAPDPHGYHSQQQLYSMREARGHGSVSEAPTTAGHVPNGSGRAGAHMDVPYGAVSIPQDFSFPEGTVDEYNGSQASDGQVFGHMVPHHAHYYSDESQQFPGLEDEWARVTGYQPHKGAQRGLGLVFDPSVVESSPGFPPHASTGHHRGKKMVEEEKADEPASVGGARQLLPSPLEP